MQSVTYLEDKGSHGSVGEGLKKEKCVGYLEDKSIVSIYVL